ncbi:MAG TPA: cyclase [Firmicutes bacterium]|nr:cyclase [Bacillota bacterium]
MCATVIDITRPTHHGMPVWRGDPQVRFAPALKAVRDGVNVARVCMGTHSGTHIDAPSHYLTSAGTVDAIPLESLVGPCFVVEIKTSGPVGRGALQECLPTPHPPRILMKTGAAAGNPKTYLDMEGAAYLIEQGTLLIGTEEMSIESASGDGSVHIGLLDAGIAILESADLGRVAPGEYDIAALPLRLVGLDGAPCRAVLIPRQ